MPVDVWMAGDALNTDTGKGVHVLIERVTNGLLMTLTDDDGERIGKPVFGSSEGFPFGKIIGRAVKDAK